MTKQKIPIKFSDKKVEHFNSDAWLSVIEVSQLLNKTAKAVREACRERKGCYKGGQFNYRMVRGNGGEQYQIALESLSVEAQNKHYGIQLETLKNNHLLVKSTSVTAAASLASIEVGAFDFSVYNNISEEFDQKPENVKATAELRLRILNEFHHLLTSGLKKYEAERIIISQYSDISKPTLWRWNGYVKNHPREYWLLFLAPSYVGRQRKEIPRVIWDYFRYVYLTESKLIISAAYRSTMEAAKANEWGEMPPVKTFERRIKTDISENEIILGRYGKTALKNKSPHLSRDKTTVPIHGIWESDGTPADVTCIWPDGTTSRPWIVCIRDIRTTMVLDITVYKSTDSALIIDSFRKALQLTMTRPLRMLMDSGTEYSNHAYTGGQKSPYRYSKPEQPIGILTRMNIKAQWLTPRHGQGKPIEGFWNIIKENVDKTFGNAYTGADPTKRPESWDKKHAVPVNVYVQKLKNEVIKWCKGDGYTHRAHGLNGKPPLDVYTELMKGHTSRPATNEELRALRPMAVQRVLSSQLVFKITLVGVGAVEYEAAENPNLKRGYNYTILPDVADPTKPALVYEGGKYMGEAIYKSKVAYLGDVKNTQPNQRRAMIYKDAKNKIDEIKQRVIGKKTTLEEFENLTLPQSLGQNILKFRDLPPESPQTKSTENENGDLIDTKTGELIPRIQIQTKITKTGIKLQDEAQELECLAEAQRIKLYR